MYLGIILLALLCLILALLLSVNYREEMSSFELKRRAEADPEYKKQLTFSKIFPGLKILLIVLDLILVVIIASIAYADWQAIGALLAFGVIVLSYLLSRSLRRLSSDLIRNNLDWLNKYFAWVEIFSRISLGYDEGRIHSRQELAHIIEKSDFMSEDDRDLVAGSLKIGDVKAKDIMTPRKEIVAVQQDDAMGLKMVDELHSTGKRVFPVIVGNWEEVVGTLYLDDVMILSKTDSKLADLLRPSLPILSDEMGVFAVLEEMAQQGVTQVLLKNNKDRVVGMLSLSQILAKLENK